jgi:hypothetical protein
MHANARVIGIVSNRATVTEQQMADEHIDEEVSTIDAGSCAPDWVQVADDIVPPRVLIGDY